MRGWFLNSRILSPPDWVLTLSIMVDFDLHLSVVSVDNVSPLRGRAAPLQHAVAPYRR